MNTTHFTLAWLLAIAGSSVAWAQEPRTDPAGAQAAARAASDAPAQRTQGVELDPRSHSYGLHARHDIRSTKTREEVRAELDAARAAASRRQPVTSN